MGEVSGVKELVSFLASLPLLTGPGTPYFAGMPPHRFQTLAEVRVKIVAPILGVAVPTVWRWVASGLFPAPRKLGTNTTVWSVGDVRAFLAATRQAA